MKKNLMLSLLTAVIVVNIANAGDQEPQIAESLRMMHKELAEIRKLVNRSNRFPFKLLGAAAILGAWLGLTCREKIEETKSKFYYYFLPEGFRLAMQATPSMGDGESATIDVSKRPRFFDTRIPISDTEIQISKRNPLRTQNQDCNQQSAENFSSSQSLKFRK